jgi:hypothetical protein
MLIIANGYQESMNFVVSTPSQRWLLCGVRMFWRLLIRLSNVMA